MVLLGMNLVWVIDDIHVGRSYVQLVIAATLAAVVVYMFGLDPVWWTQRLERLI